MGVRRISGLSWNSHGSLTRKRTVVSARNASSRGKISHRRYELALHDQNIGGGKNTTVLSMPAYLPEPSQQTGCNILCLDCRLDCRLAVQRRRGRGEEFSHPESGNVNVEPPARSLTRARITSVMLMTREMASKWDKKISDRSLDIAVLS